MTKRKIILILIEAPLPFAGAASRWYYTLCKELYNSEYDLKIFATCASKEHSEESKKIYPTGRFYVYPKRSGIKSKLNTLIRPYSYTISKEMIDDIEKEISLGPCVIHVEQTFASWALKRITPNCILSIHYLSNVDLKNGISKNLREAFVLWLMKKTEKMRIEKFSIVKACSERIENEVKSWFPNKVYHHFPFAIDSSNYRYLPKEERNNAKYITLIASMGWYPGKTAAINLLEHIWPKIKEKNPDQKLRIVGWSAKSVLKEFLNLNDVEILENVPDINKYFYEASCLVYFPSCGTGVKIKIQEAMLFGTPVVTNDDGVEGLDVKNGIHALVSNDFNQAIEDINKLINDLELQEKLREKARELIVESCNAHVIVQKMKDIYREMKL